MSNLFSGSTKEVAEKASQQEGYPSITVPGVYSVMLGEVNNETRTTNNDKEIESPLELTFYHKDSEGNIYRYHHIEFKPREEDNQDKLERKRDRILYILDKVTNKDIKIDAESWEDFTSKVKAELDKFSGKNSPVLYIKLVGNVYNGNARLQFPNYYGGCLSRKDENKKPTVSKSEQKKNDEYNQFQNSGGGKPDKESDLPSDVGAGTDEDLGSDDGLPF